MPVGKHTEGAGAQDRPRVWDHPRVCTYGSMTGPSSPAGWRSPAPCHLPGSGESGLESDSDATLQSRGSELVHRTVQRARLPEPDGQLT